MKTVLIEVTVYTFNELDYDVQCKWIDLLVSKEDIDKGRKVCEGLWFNEDGHIIDERDFVDAFENKQVLLDEFANEMNEMLKQMLGYIQTECGLETHKKLCSEILRLGRNCGKDLESDIEDNYTIIRK